MERLELPSHWINWVHTRGIMVAGRMSKSFGGIKYPIQLAIVEAGFDLRTMNLVIPVEIYDENPKTYLEFTTSDMMEMSDSDRIREQSELLVLFRLRMSEWWGDECYGDDRNR